MENSPSASVNTTAYNNSNIVNKTGMLSVRRVLIFGYNINLKLYYIVYFVLTAYLLPWIGITLVCSLGLASCILYVDVLLKLSDGNDIGLQGTQSSNK